MKPVYLAVEDRLSEVVCRKIFYRNGFSEENVLPMGLKGNGWLRSSLSKLNDLSKSGCPVFVLTDLDMAECAPSLRAEWMARIHKHLTAHFIFRIAVREVEAWIMADDSSFSEFCGCPLNQLPLNPDEELDPKQKILNLVRKYGSRDLKSDILPARGSVSSIGLGYNARLEAFLWNHWCVDLASEKSESLKRACRAVERYLAENAEGP